MLLQNIVSILMQWECQEATLHLPERPGILDQFEEELAELAISVINSGLNAMVKVPALIVSVSIFIEI